MNLAFQKEKKAFQIRHRVSDRERERKRERENKTKTTATTRYYEYFLDVAVYRTSFFYGYFNKTDEMQYKQKLLNF